MVTQHLPARGLRPNVAVWGDTIAIPQGNQVDFIDLNASEQEGRPAIALTDTANLVVFSPDGKTLATVVGQKRLQLWDVATARPITSSQNYRNRISDIIFDSDGESLLIASTNEIVRRVHIPRILHTVFELSRPESLRWLEFSADGNRLMTASRSKRNSPGLIQFWDGPSPWKQTGKSALLKRELPLLR